MSMLHFHSVTRPRQPRGRLRTAQPGPATGRALLAALAMIASLASPAAAGTSEDPELRDACGPLSTPSTVEAFPAYHDLCAAWIDSSYDEDAEMTSMTVSLRFAGDLEIRTPTYYWVAWRTPTCYYGLSLEDPTAGNGAPTARFYHCSDGGTTVLPASAVAVTGTTMTFDLAFTGQLAAAQAGHGPGTTLSEIAAGATSQAYPFTFSFCAGYCLELLGDNADAQRTHTIPVPPPKDP